MLWALILNWRVWAVLAYVGLAGWGALQTWRLGNAQDELALVQGQFDLFKDRVAAEGAEAKKKADSVIATQKRTINQTRSKYETDMAIVHEYWAGRLRGESCAGSSPVPAADSHPGGTVRAPDQSPAVGSLEACARDALQLWHLQELLKANGHEVVK